MYKNIEKNKIEKLEKSVHPEKSFVFSENYFQCYSNILYKQFYFKTI